MKEELKKEIIGTIEKIENVGTENMTKEQLVILCNNLQGHVKSQIDALEEKDSDLSTCEYKCEELEKKLEKTEAALQQAKESNDFWVNRSNEYEQKLENIKKDFSAIAQLMTTLISR